MSFEFSDGDAVVRQIYSCTECSYISTKRHFRSTEDGTACVFCQSPAEKFGEQRETTGMKSHEYQRILEWLKENRGGIGPAIVTNIKDEFPDGDDFVEACEHSYQNAEYDRLTEIDGVGQGTARNKIARGLAELKDWEDGDADPVETDNFTLSK